MLTANLEKVSTINNGTFSDTRFGSKSKGPNMEFIKLLSQKLLTPSSTIYATCNSVRYEGSLSLDGYFNLFIENSEKPFSSLSTAASFISNKPIQKGWLFWFATDKDGKEQKMEYFKKQLT